MDALGWIIAYFDSLKLQPKAEPSERMQKTWTASQFDEAFKILYVLWTSRSRRYSLLLFMSLTSEILSKKRKAQKAQDAKQPANSRMHDAAFQQQVFRPLPQMLGRSGYGNGNGYSIEHDAPQFDLGPNAL
ncbi:hypothetical protein L3Y34_011374 [Caenorhabditis briggsae]|uniref:Uncharacterized protein n=1 Tax=Caenorhabditis briggsae TaxID=6238 RepID=A0AAE9CTV7_CAEBR|nr:hypothetical protein L3Y34_011374 [Caenorhabditis briggsae]